MALRTACLHSFRSAWADMLQGYQNHKGGVALLSHSWVEGVRISGEGYLLCVILNQHDDFLHLKTQLCLYQVYCPVNYGNGTRNEKLRNF